MCHFDGERYQTRRWQKLVIIGGGRFWMRIVSSDRFRMEVLIFLLDVMCVDGVLEAGVRRHARLLRFGLLDMKPRC